MQPRTRRGRNVDLALAHLERVLEGQLRTIDSLSTKTSVMLGFSLTIVTAVIALGRAAFASRPAASSLCVACLLVATALLVSSYRVTLYENPPETRRLLRLVEGDPRRLREELLAGLARAVDRNRRAITQRFRWFNRAMAEAFVGVVIYAVGVGFA